MSPVKVHGRGNLKIPRGTPARVEPEQSKSWQEALKFAVRDPAELCRLVNVPLHTDSESLLASRDFPVFAPLGFIARMRKGDARDPLLLQVLPQAAELSSPAGYGIDPLGEQAAASSAGLLRKYQSRVLMVATGACAVHCRYCFRRHFPYSQLKHSPADWDRAIAEIARDTSLSEVILSGGDPLTLSDDHLSLLAHRLGAIGHLRRLRVHTRLPIMIPERINGELLDWLCGTALTPVVVIHANHPRELDESVAEALGRLAAAGVMLLNQAVLLKDINDDVDVLAELSERLLELRVMPYYLHQLDRVVGAAHFEVSPARGQALIRQLRSRLSGYAVPRYVREVAGASHKLVLA